MAFHKIINTKAETESWLANTRADLDVLLANETPNLWPGVVAKTLRPKTAYYTLAPDYTWALLTDWYGSQNSNITEFDPNVNYLEGDIVIYKQQVWIADKEMIDAGPFNIDDWKTFDVKGFLYNTLHTYQEGEIVYYAETAQDFAGIYIANKDFISTEWFYDLANNLDLLYDEDPSLLISTVFSDNEITFHPQDRNRLYIQEDGPPAAGYYYDSLHNEHADPPKYYGSEKHPFINQTQLTGKLSGKSLYIKYALNPFVIRANYTTPNASPFKIIGDEEFPRPITGLELLPPVSGNRPYIFKNLIFENTIAFDDETLPRMHFINCQFIEAITFSDCIITDITFENCTFTYPVSMSLSSSNNLTFKNCTSSMSALSLSWNGAGGTLSIINSSFYGATIADNSTKVILENSNFYDQIVNIQSCHDVKITACKSLSVVATDTPFIYSLDTTYTENQLTTGSPPVVAGFSAYNCKVWFKGGRIQRANGSDLGKAYIPYLSTDPNNGNQVDFGDLLFDAENSTMPTDASMRRGFGNLDATQLVDNQSFTIINPLTVRQKDINKEIDNRLAAIVGSGTSRGYVVHAYIKPLLWQVSNMSLNQGTGSGYLENDLIWPVLTPPSAQIVRAYGTVNGVNAGVPGRVEIIDAGWFKQDLSAVNVQTTTNNNGTGLTLTITCSQEQATCLASVQNPVLGDSVIVLVDEVNGDIPYLYQYGPDHQGINRWNPIMAYGAAQLLADNVDIRIDNDVIQMTAASATLLHNAVQQVHAPNLIYGTDSATTPTGQTTYRLRDLSNDTIGTLNNDLGNYADNTDVWVPLRFNYDQATNELYATPPFPQNVLTLYTITAMAEVSIKSFPNVQRDTGINYYPELVYHLSGGSETTVQTLTAIQSDDNNLGSHTFTFTGNNRPATELANVEKISIRIRSDNVGPQYFNAPFSFDDASFRITARNLGGLTVNRYEWSAENPYEGAINHYVELVAPTTNTGSYIKFPASYTAQQFEDSMTFPLENTNLSIDIRRILPSWDKIEFGRINFNLIQSGSHSINIVNTERFVESGLKLLEINVAAQNYSDFARISFNDVDVNYDVHYGESLKLILQNGELFSVIPNAQTSQFIRTINDQEVEAGTTNYIADVEMTLAQYNALLIKVPYRKYYITDKGYYLYRTTSGGQDIMINGVTIQPVAAADPTRDNLSDFTITENLGIQQFTTRLYRELINISPTTQQATATGTNPTISWGLTANMLEVQAADPTTALITINNGIGEYFTRPDETTSIQYLVVNSTAVDRLQIRYTSSIYGTDRVITLPSIGKFIFGIYDRKEIYLLSELLSFATDATTIDEDRLKPWGPLGADVNDSIVNIVRNLFYQSLDIQGKRYEYTATSSGVSLQDASYHEITLPANYSGNVFSIRYQVAPENPSSNNASFQYLYLKNLSNLDVPIRYYYTGATGDILAYQGYVLGNKTKLLLVVDNNKAISLDASDITTHLNFTWNGPDGTYLQDGEYSLAEVIKRFGENIKNVVPTYQTFTATATTDLGNTFTSDVNTNYILVKAEATATAPITINLPYDANANKSNSGRLQYIEVKNTDQNTENAITFNISNTAPARSFGPYHLNANGVDERDLFVIVNQTVCIPIGNKNHKLKITNRAIDDNNVNQTNDDAHTISTWADETIVTINPLTTQAPAQLSLTMDQGSEEPYGREQHKYIIVKCTPNGNMNAMQTLTVMFRSGGYYSVPFDPTKSVQGFLVLAGEEIILPFGGGSGGGSGGTTNYNDLFNKPSINGTTLEGNKTTAQLNIAYTDITTKPKINGVELSGDKTSAQLNIREVPTAPANDGKYYLSETVDVNGITTAWRDVLEIPEISLADTGLIMGTGPLPGTANYRGYSSYFAMFTVDTLGLYTINYSCTAAVNLNANYEFTVYLNLVQRSPGNPWPSSGQRITSQFVSYGTGSQNINFDVANLTQSFDPNREYAFWVTQENSGQGLQFGDSQSNISFAGTWSASNPNPRGLRFKTDYTLEADSQVSNRFNLIKTDKNNVQTTVSTINVQGGGSTLDVADSDIGLQILPAGPGTIDISDYFGYTKRDNKGFYGLKLKAPNSYTNFFLKGEIEAEIAPDPNGTYALVLYDLTANALLATFVDNIPGTSQQDFSLLVDTTPILSLVISNPAATILGLFNREFIADPTSMSPFDAIWGLQNGFTLNRQSSPDETQYTFGIYQAIDERGGIAADFSFNQPSIFNPQASGASSFSYNAGRTEPYTLSFIVRDKNDRPLIFYDDFPVGFLAQSEASYEIDVNSATSSSWNLPNPNNVGNFFVSIEVDAAATPPISELRVLIPGQVTSLFRVITVSLNGRPQGFPIYFNNELMPNFGVGDYHGLIFNDKIFWLEDLPKVNSSDNALQMTETGIFFNQQYHIVPTPGISNRFQLTRTDKDGTTTIVNYFDVGSGGGGGTGNVNIDADDRALLLNPAVTVPLTLNGGQIDLDVNDIKGKTITVSGKIKTNAPLNTPNGEVTIDWGNGSGTLYAGTIGPEIAIDAVVDVGSAAVGPAVIEVYDTAANVYNITDIDTLEVLTDLGGLEFVQEYRIEPNATTPTQYDFKSIDKYNQTTVIDSFTIPTSTNPLITTSDNSLIIIPAGANSIPLTPQNTDDGWRTA